MQFLEELNTEQRAAVQAGDGPVLIIAGPGTGKTKTLTARIAYVLASGQARPEEILALTFTNKAAKEMRERVEKLIGAAAAPRIATFHALGHQILGESLNEPITFITEAERLYVIRELRKKASIKQLSLRELAAKISRAKGSLGLVEDEIVELTNAYNQALAAKNLHDFDDLLAKTHQLLAGDEALRAKLQSQYRYILVDEFQDTSELQYELLNLLRGHENIFVIGDPKQSIYSFRGAEGDIFARFQADFPAHQAIALTTNYRSVPQVVRLGNTLFSDAPDLQAYSKERGTVQAVEVLNEYTEAAWVINRIEQAVGGTDLLRSQSVDNNTHFSDFAILHRTHAAARTVRKYLDESGIPYQMVGDESPYKRPAIKTIVRIMRSEPVELSGFTSGQIAALRAGLDESLPPSKLAGQIVDTFGLAGTDETTRRDLSQFISTLVRFDQAGTKAFLDYLESIAEQEFYDPQAQAVTLLTIHAAKGLEFNYVFLIAAEEDILPHTRPDKPVDIDEERRLFYVAVTRAKQQLDILHAKTRAGNIATSSRFIAELPEAVLPKITDPAMADQIRKREKRQAKNRQTTLF